MITARKSRWFERLFAAYNRNLIRRRFEGLRAAGLDHLTRRARNAPLLLYANHSSWWDGLVAFELGRACRLDQYVMMEERQLRDYPLFRRLGAFSVVRERPREALQSVRYAISLLRGTGRALWIFPQGAIFPNDRRPLNLYSGAAHIVAGAGGMYAAPVAMRYEFRDDFRPEAFALVGRPEYVEPAGLGVRPITARFASALTQTLDRLRADVVSGSLSGYEEVVAPRGRTRVLRHPKGSADIGDPGRHDSASNT